MPYVSLIEQNGNGEIVTRVFPGKFSPDFHLHFSARIFSPDNISSGTNFEPRLPGYQSEVAPMPFHWRHPEMSMQNN